MRKVLFSCLLGIFVLAVMAGAGLAHPPSDLVISYNRTDGMLAVNAPHSVPDGRRHYIEEFTVSVDGNVYYRLLPSWQIEGKEAVAAFHMGELKAGAVVEVYAKCSRAGDLKKSFTVE
jgi:hypothetical protein